jgi:DNA polymerase III gamma/tau subunit
VKKSVLGHTQQQKSLARLAASGKLPTTILFSGVSGIGKSLVARKLAASLLCAQDKFGGCSECEYCSLLDAGNHPDFFFINCADKGADLDSLRDLLYSLNLKSFYGGKRVVIFNDADALGTQASNLLLKSLEEPRPDTYFILVASNRGALPPTLVSRCQVWFFDRLTDAEVKKLLEPLKEKIEEASLSATELVALADGTVDQLEALIEKSELWRRLGTTLNDIAAGKLALATELTQELAKDKEHLPETMKLMRLHARSRMCDSKLPEEKNRWAICLSNLLTAERAIFERNLAAGPVLLTILLSLHSPAGAPSFTTFTNSARLLDKSIV